MLLEFLHRDGGLANTTRRANQLHCFPAGCHAVDQDGRMVNCRGKARTRHPLICRRRLPYGTNWRSLLPVCHAARTRSGAVSPSIHRMISGGSGSKMSIRPQNSALSCHRLAQHATCASGADSIRAADNRPHLTSHFSYSPNHSIGTRPPRRCIAPTSCIPRSVDHRLSSGGCDRWPAAPSR